MSDIVEEKKANVFIIWSGQRSNEIANNLRDWLPRVIQTIRPWMSETDINKGRFWRSDLANQLKDTKIGIICLVPENLASPWIHYEAGAMSKTIEDTYICPYLFQLKPENINRPLSDFQSTKAEKEDTLKLLHTINIALGKKLEEKLLVDNFEVYWPQFDEKLKKIQDYPTKVESQWSDRELLEGIYRHVNKEVLLLQNTSLSNIMCNRKEIEEKLQIDQIVHEFCNSVALGYEEIKKTKYKYNDIKDLYLEEAERKIWDVTENINKMKTGHLVVSRERGLHILLELIQASKESIFATSIIPSRDFWFTDFGERYFNANENACKKGVKIKRIFIKPKTLNDDEKARYSDLINRQVKSKITVKEAVREALPEGLITDFAILDNKLVFYLQFKDDDKNFPTIDHADIYVNPYEIKKACDIFKEIDASYAKYIKDDASIQE